jgi:hypothetical protein
MVAGYTANGDSFAARKPQVWSPKSLLVLLCQSEDIVDAVALFGVPPYDLAPDGKRFAAVLYLGGTAEHETKPITSVTVLLNFFDELRRRVPVEGK